MDDGRAVMCTHSTCIEASKVKLRAALAGALRRLRNQSAADYAAIVAQAIEAYPARNDELDAFTLEVFTDAFRCCLPATSVEKIEI